MTINNYGTINSGNNETIIRLGYRLSRIYPHDNPILLGFCPMIVPRSSSPGTSWLQLLDGLRNSCGTPLAVKPSPSHSSVTHLLTHNQAEAYVRISCFSGVAMNSWRLLWRLLWRQCNQLFQCEHDHFEIIATPKHSNIPIQSLPCHEL